MNGRPLDVVEPVSLRYKVSKEWSTGKALKKMLVWRNPPDPKIGPTLNFFLNLQGKFLMVFLGTTRSLCVQFHQNMPDFDFILTYQRNKTLKRSTR